MERLIAGRYLVAERLGAGGMGAVFRATDQRRGNAPVAVKVLHQEGGAVDVRFAREIEILAQIDHPGVVRYLDHGRTELGEHFLVTELLEGVDLAARLASSPLSLRESLDLAARVADALAAAHRRGVVHRDVKPANLFLVGGRADDVRVLDFGIARSGDLAAPGATRSGAVVGTPGYLAPEQARGERRLTPAVDVFALGCVLYECIAGRRPFAGNGFAAVLASVLFTDPPRLRDVRPDAPAAVDDLLARMLARDPRDRPPDGAAVAAALGTFDAVRDLAGPPPDAAPVPLAEREQRVVSVVWAGAPEARDGDPLVTTAADWSATSSDALSARWEVLVSDGSRVAVFAELGTALDQATRAARAALGLAAASPGVAIVVATGRGVVSTGRPTGEVIDRAARMFEAARANPVGGVVVDELSADLLAERFDVDRGPDGVHRLRGARLAFSAPRLLLGQPTRCVGRDRELAHLASLLDACVDEPAAHAALLTAAPGTGKSRLLHEFVERARASECAPEMLFGRAEPGLALTPFGALAQLVRRAAGVQEGDDPAVRRDRLRRRVARHVAAADVGRVAVFLGEMAGVPFEDDAHPELRAARADSRRMGAAIRGAWEAWLLAESDARPVVIVLDDLHWCDLATVQVVGGALRRLRDRPLLVVAAARPEVHATFPDLWADCAPSALALPRLGRRVSEQLAREALGTSMPSDVIGRVVERAEGNAFYLEELIRAVAWGAGDDAVPDSVLGMLQSRLDALPEEARRALRAASVFGRAFSGAGLAALLGGPGNSDAALGALDDLVEREVVLRERDDAGPTGDRFVFSHAILRDAAYASLVDDDRREGHQRAARWIERGAEAGDRIDQEAAVAAGHYLAAGSLDDAARLLRVAGHRSLRLFALDDAIGQLRLASETLARLPETRARLETATDLLLERYSACFVVHTVAADVTLDAAREAAALAERLGDPGRRAQAESALASCAYGRADVRACVEHSRRALDLAETTDDMPTLAAAYFVRASSHLLVGKLGPMLAELPPLIERLARGGHEADRFGLAYAPYVTLTGGVAMGRALTGPPEPAEALLAGGLAAARASGSPYGVAIALTWYGHTFALRGERARCESQLREAVRLGVEERMPTATLLAGYKLATVLALDGDLDGAERELAAADELAGAVGYRTYRVDERYIRALILLGRGRLDEAEALGRAELDEMLASGEVRLRAEFHRLLGVLHARRGAIADAEACFRASLRDAAEVGAVLFTARTEASWAEALAGAGRADDDGHGDRARAAFAALELRAP